MTAITNKEENLPSTDLLDDLTASAEEYSQSLGREDMSIPFLQLLQALSPQCTKGDPDYIKEAQPSMLYNTVSRALTRTLDDDDKQVHDMKVVSLMYKSSYIEWVPRAKGGGFVKEWSVAEAKDAVTYRNESNQDIISDNSPVGTPENQLTLTHTHFVLILGEDGSFEPAVLSMSSTQVKSSKDWNALIDKVRLPNKNRAPRFYGVWGVSSRLRQNDQGSWYILDFSKQGVITDLGDDQAREIMQASKTFIDGVKAGEHKADYAKASTTQENVATVDVESDDVPF